MQIKCFLFLDQYVAPVKTITLNFPKDPSDDEIKTKAAKEFKKGFRIEYEDARNPLHPPYNKKCDKNLIPHRAKLPLRLPVPVQVPKTEQISRNRIRVNGKIKSRADILKKHGMTPYQYNYLRCIKKYSMVEIFEKGLSLYVHKRKSQS